MRLTVAAVLCVLTVSSLYGPDHTSGILARRRRVVTRRRTTRLTTRRSSPSGGSGGSYYTCMQQYICTLKYMANNTLYSMSDAYPPVGASKVNLCRTGGTRCTYYKSCYTRYLTNGRTLTTNLDAWTATHWGNVTRLPKPESVKLCDSAPGGMTQKGTVMTLVASVTLGLVTGLCFLPR